MRLGLDVSEREFIACVIVVLILTNRKELAELLVPFLIK